MTVHLIHPTIPGQQALSEGAQPVRACDPSRLHGGYPATGPRHHCAACGRVALPESSTARCQICSTVWRFNNAESARSWLDEHMAGCHPTRARQVR